MKSLAVSIKNFDNNMARRGLIQMVGKPKRLLKYLESKLITYGGAFDKNTPPKVR